MENKKNIFQKIQEAHSEIVSHNLDSANQYLKEEGVDVNYFVGKGLELINKAEIKKVEKVNKALFFKRVVLAARIVDEAHSEITFGHVKLQKLMYLCEQLSQMQISKRYVKEAAGPYDRKLMHSIDRELERLKWFKVEVKESKKSKYVKYYIYRPGEKKNDYLKYYNNYYKTRLTQIDWLIETFKKPETKKVELIATIYACLIEFIEKNESFSQELLVNKVFGWSEEKKKKFTKEKITSAYTWMLNNSLIPASKDH